MSNFFQKIKGVFKNLGVFARTTGKNLDLDRPLEEQRNVTFIEYISVCLSKMGTVLVSTLSGMSTAGFLYGLYYVNAFTSMDVAKISAMQTTITFFLGYIVGAIVAVVAYKWKSKWGRYRQWYLICAIPLFAITILNYVVFHFDNAADGSFVFAVKYMSQSVTIFGYELFPAIDVSTNSAGLITMKWILAILGSIINGFSGIGANITQVISPNPKEKKLVAVMQQIFYYIGYGGAYIYFALYAVITNTKNDYGMYISLAIVGGILTLVGNAMMAIFCRERIELPKKEKVKVSGAMFKLFKYKNYTAYQIMQWVNCLAMLGMMTTYIANITVGAGLSIAFGLPSAAGTAVGVAICTALSKKVQPTTMLKFCGIFTPICAVFAFGSAWLTTIGGQFMRLNFLFYLAYFLFGTTIGLQELSNTYFNVEYQDYLEWQTGERLEAIQGLVPGWITSFINYVKGLAIPVVVALWAYPTGSTEESELTNIAQAAGVVSYNRLSLSLLALMFFGYAISNLVKALLLFFVYDIEGDKKTQMYAELTEMRKQRHIENEQIAAAEQQGA